MKKSNDKAFTLENLKEYAKDMVYKMAEESIDQNRSITDDSDMMVLRDDLENLLDICDRIDKCKNRKGIEKVLKEYYTKKKIKEGLGV